MALQLQILAINMINLLKEILFFLKDVANNYDCDEDAHKYNTRCRSCEAQKLLILIDKINYKKDF